MKTYQKISFIIIAFIIFFNYTLAYSYSCLKIYTQLKKINRSEELSFYEKEIEKKYSKACDYYIGKKYYELRQQDKKNLENAERLLKSASDVLTEGDYYYSDTYSYLLLIEIEKQIPKIENINEYYDKLKNRLSQKDKNEIQRKISKVMGYQWAPADKNQCIYKKDIVKKNVKKNNDQKPGASYSASQLSTKKNNKRITLQKKVPEVEINNWPVAATPKDIKKNDIANAKMKDPIIYQHEKMSYDSQPSYYHQNSITLQTNMQEEECKQFFYGFNYEKSKNCFEHFQQKNRNIIKYDKIYQYVNFLEDIIKRKDMIFDNYRTSCDETTYTKNLSVIDTWFRSKGELGKSRWYYTRKSPDNHHSNRFKVINILAYSRCLKKQNKNLVANEILKQAQKLKTFIIKEERSEYNVILSRANMNNNKKSVSKDKEEVMIAINKIKQEEVKKNFIFTDIKSAEKKYSKLIKYLEGKASEKQKKREIHKYMNNMFSIISNLDDYEQRILNKIYLQISMYLSKGERERYDKLFQTKIKY